MGKTIDRSVPPEIKPLDTLTLPQGHTSVTPEGVALHYFEGGVEDLTAVSLVWKGGNAETGISDKMQLALSMMREGHDGMSSEEVADALDFNGASYASQASDHTSQLSIVSLESCLPKVMDIVAGSVTTPSMPSNVLEAMKSRQANNLKVELSKVSVQADRLAAEMMAGAGNPLCRYASPDEILSWTRDELLNLAESTCRTVDGLEIFAAGKISAEVDRCLRGFVGRLAELSDASGRKVIDTPFCPCPPGRREVKVPGTLQSAISVIIPAIPRTHPDYTDLRMAVMALGGYFGSRLMANIREEKGYTYGISGGLIGVQDGSYINIRSQQDVKYTEAVIEEIVKEIEILANSPMDADELERVRSFAMTQLATNLDTPFDIAHYRMLETSSGMPHDYFNRMQQSIIGITPEKIAEITARYILPSMMRTAIATS